MGSGPIRFQGRTDIINIDLYGFAEVDMIADACYLPIETETVDAIINVALLEHVRDPRLIVKEMYRTLKPGGEILAYVPFLVPFHAAPHDYHRWTFEGAKALFSMFDGLDAFIGCGPTSGMLYVMEAWLATLLSFGVKPLHDVWFLFFILLFFPVKYADIILERYGFAHHLASGFGIVAKKLKA
jgi:SAM-dependent methyltransferase